MVPAWSLALALLVGAAAGWYLHGSLGRTASPVAGAHRGPVEPAAPAPRAAAAEPADATLPSVTETLPPAASKEAARMDALLGELERRYEGRTGEDVPARPAAKPRSRRKAG